MTNKNNDSYRNQPQFKTNQSLNKDITPDVPTFNSNAMDNEGFMPLNSCSGGCGFGRCGRLFAAQKGRQYADGARVRYAGAVLYGSGVERQRNRHRREQRHNQGLFDACLSGEVGSRRGRRHRAGGRPSCRAGRRTD